MIHQKPNVSRKQIIIYCANGTYEPIHDSVNTIHEIWYKKTAEALSNSSIILKALMFYKDYLVNENKYDSKELTGAKDNSKNFSRVR